MHKLLDTVYQLGLQMQDALEANDLEQFNELLLERQTHIEQLGALEASENGKISSNERFNEIQEQFASMLTTLRQKEQETSEALLSLEKLKTARRHYHHEPQRRQILHPKLSG